MSAKRCGKRVSIVVDDDWDELVRCALDEGHSADYYSSEAGTFVPEPTAHRFEFTVDPDPQPTDRCVKCGGPDGFHDPACVIHPMDHQPSERES